MHSLQCSLRAVCRLPMCCMFPLVVGKLPHVIGEVHKHGHHPMDAGRMKASHGRRCTWQDAVLNPKFANNDVKAAAAKLEEDVKTLADNPQSLLLEARPRKP